MPTPQEGGVSVESELEISGLVSKIRYAKSAEEYNEHLDNLMVLVNRLYAEARADERQKCQAELLNEDKEK